MENVAFVEPDPDEGRRDSFLSASGVVDIKGSGTCRTVARHERRAGYAFEYVRPCVIRSCRCPHIGTCF